LWLRLKIRRRIKRDINTYNRTYILLYILPELLRGYKGRNKGDIKYITLKDPSSIFSIKRLIILLFNIFKIRDVFRVLYTFKLDFRPES
jgi:hypothetical protein